MAAEPLTKAAAARHERAVERAERALRDLGAEGTAVSFQSVARRAVSHANGSIPSPHRARRSSGCATEDRLVTMAFPPASEQPRRHCASAWRRCAPKTSACGRRTATLRMSSPSPTGITATTRPAQRPTCADGPADGTGQQR